jgi:hypothetical protein
MEEGHRFEQRQAWLEILTEVKLANSRATKVESRERVVIRRVDVISEHLLGLGKCAGTLEA